MYKFALAFVLAVTLLVEFRESSADYINGKVLVTINNTLSNNKKLIVHCKNKDDDLGTVDIAPRHAYQFYANKSSRENTSYNCDFTFDNKLHWFHVYDQNIDSSFCRKVCYYEADENRICRYLSFMKNDMRYRQCFKWNRY
ncbi:hypothetical protein RND81_08G174600 [Saponaria officinalis]|uniref:S-protein homolog n=1 Tax=Saponaria officinalis TaxID=3572 RepID=A0AAW1JA83_SAPOF